MDELDRELHEYAQRAGAAADEKAQQDIAAQAATRAREERRAAAIEAWARAELLANSVVDDARNKLLSMGIKLTRMTNGKASGEDLAVLYEVNLDGDLSVIRRQIKSSFSIMDDGTTLLLVEDLDNRKTIDRGKYQTSELSVAVFRHIVANMLKFAKAAS